MVTVSTMFIVDIEVNYSMKSDDEICDKIINEIDNMDDEEMKKLEEDGKDFLKTIEEIYARC